MTKFTQEELSVSEKRNGKRNGKIIVGVRTRHHKGYEKQVQYKLENGVIELETVKDIETINSISKGKKIKKK